jgi:hypothetical protein
MSYTLLHLIPVLKIIFYLPFIFVSLNDHGYKTTGIYFVADPDPAIYQSDEYATTVLDTLHGSSVSHQASVVSLVEPPFRELSILIRITLLALIRIRLFNRMQIRIRPPKLCGSGLATLDRIWPKYTYRVPSYAAIPLRTRTGMYFHVNFSE